MNFKLNLKILKTRKFTTINNLNLNSWKTIYQK